MKLTYLTALAPLALLGACATAPVEPTRMSAPVISAAGKQIGTATWWSDPSATHVELKVSGLTPGPHGVHFHSVGKCDAPEFTSAGGHWNPTDKKHGHNNPAGWHMGDMGNINVRSNGIEETMLMLPAGAGFFDADGTALVIHTGPDDEMTDPSGNSGGRIACAVMAPTH